MLIKAGIGWPARGPRAEPAISPGPPAFAESPRWPSLTAKGASSSSRPKIRADRRRLKELLAGLRDVVDRYDLHRGWFGTGTLLHSVTCHPGHPLEVIGQGLDQGNDWFTFSGYMDFLMLKQLPEWLQKVGLDIPVDVGTGKATHSLGTIAYGLRSYDGLKIQDMPTEEEWIKFVKDRGGHLFRPVYAPDCDKYKYDGQIAIDGNKKQIDTEDVPFILQTGLIKDEAAGLHGPVRGEGQAMDP